MAVGPEDVRFLGVFFGPKFWTKEDFHGRIELEIVSM